MKAFSCCWVSIFANMPPYSSHLSAASSIVSASQNNA